MKLKISLEDAGEVDDLIKELTGAALEKTLVGGVRQKVRDAATSLHQKLLQNIDNGRPDWPELSEVTRELKGSDKPLNDSGTLRQAIQLRFVGETALVGIPEGSAYPDGTPVDLVAGVMEEGAVIKVTDRMRAFFGGRGFPLRKDTQVIVIPARPFFEPAVKEFMDELVGMVAEVSAQAMA